MLNSLVGGTATPGEPAVGVSADLTYGQQQSARQRRGHAIRGGNGARELDVGRRTEITHVDPSLQTGTNHFDLLCPQFILHYSFLVFTERHRCARRCAEVLCRNIYLY